MDNELEPNSWGIKSVVEIQDAFELWCTFQMFCYYNKRLLLTNGLLIVPNGKTTRVSEKSYLKTLYEMLQGTKSNGLVSLQFLSALNIFFGGSVDLSRDAITGLYNNLLFEALSRQQNLIFEKFLTSSQTWASPWNILFCLMSRDRPALMKQ